MQGAARRGIIIKSGISFFKLILLVGLLCLTGGGAAIAAPPPPAVIAEAAVVVDGSSGKTLFAKNADKVMYPASTTKIMTCLVALERGNLDSVVTVGWRAASTDESSLGLRAGDKLTLRELLMGMMVVSGNDAAEAVAEHVGGGSRSRFIQWMNEKAESLGMSQTHFSNPHGLPDPVNHFTTAADLAKLTLAARQEPEFRRIVATNERNVTFLNRRPVFVRNTNRLLRTFPGADGVKTGYTDAAGECLVASATRQGKSVVAVILNSDLRWEEAKYLLEYGFASL